MRFFLVEFMGHGGWSVLMLTEEAGQRCRTVGQGEDPTIVASGYCDIVSDAPRVAAKAIAEYVAKMTTKPEGA